MLILQLDCAFSYALIPILPRIQLQPAGRPVYQIPMLTLQLIDVWQSVQLFRICLSMMKIGLVWQVVQKDIMRMKISESVSPYVIPPMACMPTNLQTNACWSALSLIEVLI